MCSNASILSRFLKANFASQQRVPQTEAREVDINASDDEEVEVYELLIIEVAPLRLIAEFFSSSKSLI